MMEFFPNEISPYGSGYQELSLRNWGQLLIKCKFKIKSGRGMSTKYWKTSLTLTLKLTDNEAFEGMAVESELTSSSNASNDTMEASALPAEPRYPSRNRQPPRRFDPSAY